MVYKLLVNFIAVILVCCLGCGTSTERKTPDLVPFSGIVSVDGTPANLAMIKLLPSGDTKGFGGFAVTSKDGTFEITANGSSKKGIPAGTYKVLISTFFLGEGYSPGSPDNPPGMQPLTPEQGTPTEIPSIYGDDQQTPLEITVGTNGDAKNFELKSK